MKLIVEDNSNTVTLRVFTRGKDLEDVVLPKENIHYWYPFNTNFSYRCSSAKKSLYLIKERSHVGENVYGVDTLKKTKPLDIKDGVPYHPQVHRRNLQVIDRAKQLGIVTIEDNFTLALTVAGFQTVCNCIDAIKSRAQERVDDEEIQGVHTHLNEEWDERVYEKLTKEEGVFLLELGEIYGMLTVMRKLAVAKGV